MGRHARVVWAREKGLLSFPDLVPAAVGSPEVFVGSDGTVQPRRREMEFAPTDGVHPVAAAWIAGDAFIGLLQMTVLPYIVVSLIGNIGGITWAERKGLLKAGIA